MAYRLEMIDSVMHVDLRGEFTAEELIAVFGEIAGFEDSLPQTPNRIAYMSGLLTADLDYRVMDSLAMRRRQKRFPNAFRTALVAPNAVAYGFARMFQSLNTNPQIEIRIFSDERAALVWVSEPPEDRLHETSANHA